MRKRHYRKKAPKELSGAIEIKRQGFGFVRDEGGDVFVPAVSRNGALNGDTVKVRIVEEHGPKSREGEVIKIVDEAEIITSGTLRAEKKRAFIEPDDRRLPEIEIKDYSKRMGKNGVKAMCRIISRGEGGDRPLGEIIEVLGYPWEKGVDILCVARTFGLNDRFPKPAQNEAKASPKKVSSRDLAGREDWRARRVFTIDGDDAKDLDDAVSIERLPDGYEIGVHIADVSNYVREDGALDREALKRGTSVYLVDKVIPMLPAQLSNGVCSLNEGEDRLTLSCVIKLDRNYKVAEHRIVKSVICSSHRLTYKNVNRLFSGDGAMAARYSDIARDLDMMNGVAKKLRAMREAHGSIDFEIDEANILVDERGEVVDVAVRERGDAEKLIEEFMLLANRTVAAEYRFREVPFVFRVHEPPPEDKVRELALFLTNFGFKLHLAGDGLKSSDLQAVLDASAGRPGEALINRVVLRSMSKAVYKDTCDGHFGLGFENYCHFTSPIRRYPDLQIHRIIKQIMDGSLDVEEMGARVARVSEISSARERNAMEAERKIDDIKKCEYMKKHLGEVFDGVISGVTNSVMFVELLNTCEGAVPLSSLEDDYYVYYEKLHCVIGERTKKRYSLGDSVKVVILEADPGLPRTTMGLYKEE